MTREKLLAQMNVRMSLSDMSEIDVYVEERMREARVPLSRAQAFREIVGAWAQERRSSRTRTRRRSRPPRAIQAVAAE